MSNHGEQVSHPAAKTSNFAREASHKFIASINIKSPPFIKHNIKQATHFFPTPRMDLQPLSTPPDESTFQPLSEYQSATPATFFSGPPVLHHHSPHCTLTLSSDDLSVDPILSALAPSSSSTSPTGLNGSSPTSDSISLDVSTYVLSTTLLLWSDPANKGVSIPYRAISLHAVQGSGIWLQLCLDDVRNVPDEELRTLEMVLTPSSAPSDSTSDVTAAGTTNGGTEGANAGGARGPNARPQTEVQRLFEALSACADLHPDPVEEDEGGLGVGGDGELGGQWITAENMHEFEGQEGEEDLEGLGPGAGTRRGPDEDAGEDGDETKWRRTD
ncbi:hypothetical protein K461DRAFT_293715 [Myriangium duriaei CBS 260.36]|uniref:Regulator of volume decrease after cellular swelling-domain-containing protein n=1 Tax=Myriangium duriaei CBS 260.36 TaxID=1168546 RepID=A0A9P4MGC6_9PEZI|nr:hypothetical protein K461DRAFT_293715 [Myriangium duriaei CBS 260.36]